jgi:hypothetical protein
MTAPDVRRAGNGSGKITREAVLAAALEIFDRDGAEALSMRRLARALDRDPMMRTTCPRSSCKTFSGSAPQSSSRPTESPVDVL